jgi:hypothetical protein
LPGTVEWTLNKKHRLPESWRKKVALINLRTSSIFKIDQKE